MSGVNANGGSRDDGVAPPRRGVLRGAGVAGVAALSGCLGLGPGGSGGDTLPTPVMGDREAPVTVAAFEDYACPHCRRYNAEVVPRLVADYVEPGRVRYEHHDFPIPVDPEVSWEAASAARAVQDTVGVDAFWTYSALLYENQPDLGPETYAALAAEVDADGETVRSAAVDERYRSTVQADRQAGLDRGVQGTPTVFVDGQAVEASYVAVSRAIENA